MAVTIILVTMPFVIVINQLLTGLVERNTWYLWIQQAVVPVEAKILGVLLISLGLHFSYSPTNSLAVNSC